MNGNDERRPWEKVQYRRRDFYIYEAFVAALGVGLSANDVINIEADSDFILQKLTFHADIGGAAQTEATRVRGGKVVPIDGQDWIFPDEAECLQCHTSVAGQALGLETSQLNRDFTYPSTGRTHNQLETLDEIMMFASPLAGTPATLPSMPDPADSDADTGERAREYLHTNCAQCHQPGGPTPVDIDFRYTTLLANTNACDAAPQAGDLGLVNPRIITPGVASRSVMVARVNRRDSQGMPPLASSIVDADGVVLLSDWIDGLTGCN